MNLMINYFSTDIYYIIYILALFASVAKDDISWSGTKRVKDEKKENLYLGC